MAFIGNMVATNTSFQDIPSQDTRVEGQLAKFKDNEFIVDADFEKFKSNERVKWKGGRLWNQQTEEDSEEGDIPEEMQSEEEAGGDEREDDDQSVNGTVKIVKNTTDGQK